jgi:putative DNA primase/helicase
MFKAITGGDTVVVERKYKDQCEVDLYVCFVFSANEMPQTYDTTEAFWRRFVVVPFHNRITGLMITRMWAGLLMRL